MLQHPTPTARPTQTVLAVAARIYRHAFGLLSVWIYVGYAFPIDAEQWNPPALDKAIRGENGASAAAALITRQAGTIPRSLLSAEERRGRDNWDHWVAAVREVDDET